MPGRIDPVEGVEAVRRAASSPRERYPERPGPDSGVRTGSEPAFTAVKAAREKGELVSAPGLRTSEQAEGPRMRMPIRLVFDTRLRFVIHDGSDGQELSIEIIDIENGKILRRIPPYRILEWVLRIGYRVGLFVDG